MNQASNVEKNTSLSTEMIIDFTNFVETAIHQILYGERIYPENIFEDKSIYGLEVKILKRNVLYDYVHELCIKLEDLIRRDILESIQVRICKEKEKPTIYEIEIEKAKKFDQMDCLPDKFEFDAYLKRFLYSIIEQRKPLTTEAVSPKSNFFLLLLPSLEMCIFFLVLDNT